MPTRRAFLKGVAGATVLGGVATASHPRQQPDHVTIAYEESTLKQYRPLLDITQADREKLLGLYGWVARSSEHDTAVCVYWCSYTHQEPPWWAPETGHFGDHEPVQVEFDPDSGDAKRVRASVYHWIKGETTGDAAPLDGTNPTLRVINPYHHYTAQPDVDSTAAFAVKDLTQEMESWLDNGLEDTLVEGAVYNPWMMRDEADFWAPGRFGLPSGEATQARVARDLGFGVVGDL